MLDGLISAPHEGERINDDELLAISFLLLVAGYDTTVNLASGVLSLLRNPDQYAALCADPTLIRPAIEDLLRHESPVKITPFARFTTTEVTLGGVVIPAHQALPFAFGAGNRDPAQFADPDRLDLSRSGRTCRSATAFTSAWARRWPGSKPRSRSPRCWRDAPISRSPSSPARSRGGTARVMCGLKRLPVTFMARALATTPRSGGS